MPKLYPKEVRDVVGALRHEGVGPREIMRRLNEGTAGLGYKVQMKERRVHELIADYNEIHGPPPDPEAAEIDQDSKERLRRRAMALIQREIAALEKKRPGTLTAKQASALRVHYGAIAAAERADEATEKARLAPSKRSKIRKEARAKRSTDGGGSAGASGGEESPIERIAREQLENAENPAPPRAEPPSPHQGPQQ